MELSCWSQRDFKVTIVQDLSTQNSPEPCPILDLPTFFGQVGLDPAVWAKLLYKGHCKDVYACALCRCNVIESLTSWSAGTQASRVCCSAKPFCYFLLTTSPTQPSIEINHPFVIPKTSLFYTCSIFGLDDFLWVKMLCVLGISG